jgi:hypothetical protein
MMSQLSFNVSTSDAWAICTQEFGAALSAMQYWKTLSAGITDAKRKGDNLSHPRGCLMRLRFAHNLFCDRNSNSTAN